MTDNESQLQPQQQRRRTKRIIAALAYVVFFVPILTEYKDDPYVKFHTQQGIVLFVSYVMAFVITVVPLVGWFASLLLTLCNVILLVLGVLNAISARQKELPIIGKYAHHVKL